MTRLLCYDSSRQHAAAMKEKLANQGAEVLTMTPEQFGDLIRKEKARWAKVVKDSGAKFE
jgi:tripartite-type tricarboxylate transporter receptor subunit TctC